MTWQPDEPPKEINWAPAPKRDEPNYQKKTYNLILTVFVIVPCVVVLLYMLGIISCEMQVRPR